MPVAAITSYYAYLGHTFDPWYYYYAGYCFLTLLNLPYLLPESFDGPKPDWLDD